MLLDILSELLCRMLAGKRVGIVAIGQHQHLDIHTLGQQHVSTTNGSMNARLVAVVEQHDVLREAVQQLHLMRRERRARVGNHILQPALVHGYHVGIALHHIHAVLLNDGSLSLIDAVELALLMVDFRVGRVDILLLHALGSRIELSPAKGYDLAADVQPGEDGTSGKSVYQHAFLPPPFFLPATWLIPISFALIAQPGLYQEFVLIALPMRFV